MKKILIFFVVIFSTFSFANSDISLDLEEDFLQSLDEVSQIATKTKLNIDETPSFVTVLHAKELKKLGITNVFEALSRVPGVQLSKEISGVPVVIFRGVTQKGEVKLMVDGVTINNSYRGSIYNYLDFPVELIKRIEIIRGAGSVLYGSNAISGVINIITNISQNESQNSVFVSAGSYDWYRVGSYLSTNIKDFKISLDAYSQKNDKSIFVGMNNSGQIGDSDRHLKDYSAGINISNKGFSLIARLKKSNMGSAYGVFGVLDTDLENLNNINTTIFTQFSYNKSINKTNRFSLIAGYNKYIQEVDTKVTATKILDTRYKEATHFAELNYVTTSFENNELLIGMRYEYAKTLQSEWKISQIPIIPISNPNLSRKTYSLFLNDTYSFFENLKISAGARYEHYSDFKDTLNPNVGMVYKLTNEVSLKALYSHSYRAPSWIELTSNPALDAEKSNSFEAGIIYKQNHQNVLRTNIYTSTISDMIVKDTTKRKYIQNSKNKFLGVEMEYIYTPNTQLEINIFASYIDTKDTDGIELANVANILASSSLTYEVSYFTFGSLLKYVSKSNRAINDARDKMDESIIFDQTISYDYKNFTASLIIKDLFNTNTYYALPKNGYNCDFNDGGRSVMIKFSLDF